MPAVRRPFSPALLAHVLIVASTAAAAAAAPAGSAAGPAAEAPGTIIAKAGSIEFRSADVQALIERLPAPERASVTSDLAALEQVVRAEMVRRAVLAEARAKGLERQPEALALLNRVHDEALVRLWLANQSTVPAGYPSTEELNAAYEANKQALAAPTEYHLAQIFVRAPDGADPAKLAAALRKASDVGALVAKGTDFSLLARQQSEHAESAGKGGDLGYLAENAMLPEIAATARTMKPGEVIGPVKTAQGLHFLKLMDKRAGAVPSLAEAHDRLEAALRARRSAELQQNYLSGLGSSLGVTVNQIELAKLRATLK
jgi:parvulin-like peptidyl-prolyl isomerase